MIIAVHALGYVGITCAISFAQKGRRVIGYDPDKAVVDAINAGKPKTESFLSYLGEIDYASLLKATTEFNDTLAANVHIIAVPSERDDEPFMDIVGETLRRIAVARQLDQTLVIIESTLQPGAVDGFLTAYPELTKAIDAGDIEIAVCPRRDWFCDKEKNLSTLPRVVGGMSPSATEWALSVLSVVTPYELLMRTDYRTAELTKALENALFHAPIALCHSLALTYPDLDVAEAARLAATHWRFASFGGLHLNIGTSGRCVPLGPKYLRVGAGDQDVDLLDSILDTEDLMPEAVAAAVVRRVGAKARVLILGVAYRPGFRDSGMSGGLRVAAAFPDTVTVGLADPYFSVDEIAQLAEDKYGVHNFDVVELTDLDLDQYSAVILATPHTEFESLPSLVNRFGQVVFDARGAWQKHEQSFRDRGILYTRVGAPGWR